MRTWNWILGPVLVTALLEGCRENAGSFFSGRPSGMAMTHNRVLDGSVDAMVDLLRIPHRFPDANESQKGNWQESVMAWWGAKNGRGRMLAALPRLTEPEMQHLENWVAARDQLRTEEKAATLDAITVAIRAFRARDARTGG